MKAKSVLIISGHLGNSKRKASIHFIAENMALLGYKTYFLTIGLSQISHFKADDERVGQLPHFPQNNWFAIAPNMQNFIWYSLFHPFNLKNKWLNFFSVPIFALYPLFLPRIVLEVARQTDLIVIESGLGILLAPRLKKINPNATFIYTASDRLSTLQTHPMLEKTLQQCLPWFGLVRVPAQSMLGDFKPAKTVHIPHGIDKKLFDTQHPNPYPGKLNAISIGNMLYDEFTIATLAKNLPNVTFHLFGKGVATHKNYANVVVHGEKPFAQLVPYIQHASFGIAPYKMSESADYLSQSSLKMIQYTYCRLPIVAPAFAAAGRPHVCAYQPNNATSIIAAGKQALAYPRQNISTKQVLSWQESTHMMLKNAKKTKKKS